MERRDALAALLCLGALPLCARGEAVADKPRKVGVLTLAAPAGFRARRDAFVARMRELGYVDARNVRYDWRFAAADLERLPALAKELLDDGVELAVADSTYAALALRQAMASVPVVIAAADDPRASRLVRTLAQPEGRFTGSLAWDPEKMLESVKLLAGVLPKGSVVGVLLNPGNATYRKIRSRARYAAVQEGLTPAYLDASNAREIATALGPGMRRENVAGVIVMSDALFFEEHVRIAKMLAQARKPAIHPHPQFVEAGGLMSYGPDMLRHWERAAEYVDRVLKGEKPAQMPVAPPPDYELVVSRGAARSLRIAMPDELVKRARMVA